MVRVQGLSESALSAVASLGTRPTVEDAGRVLLETHGWSHGPLAALSNWLLTRTR